MFTKSKIIAVLVLATALSGCGAGSMENLKFWDNKEEPAPSTATTAKQAQPFSIRDQVIVAKNECEKLTLTKPQWYRCWIPKAERIHEAQGYPHMDLLKVHFSELTMINNSIEKGAVTPDQGEAMIAQSMVRFNNAVIGREQAVRDREMKNWKEFRGYIESAEPADPSLAK